MPFFSFNKQFAPKPKVSKKEIKTKIQNSIDIIKDYAIGKAERNELLGSYPIQKTYELSNTERNLLINNNITLEISEQNNHPKSIKKRALLAGINYLHCDEKLRLNGCINDVVSMANVLKSKYGYSDNNIVLLRDDGIQNKWPTRYNIIRELEKAVSYSKDLDEIWFHYSGHGSQVNDINGDETDGKDEVLVPCDYKTNGIILDDTLFAILDKSKCPIILTIDCCHSGTISDLTYTFHPNPLNRNNFTRVVQNNRPMENKNIYMFSGCRDDQTSADVQYYKAGKKINEGAFTSALIEALRFHKHHVSLIQLYVTILEVLQSRGYSQRTVFSSSNPEPHVVLTVG